MTRANFKNMNLVIPPLALELLLIHYNKLRMSFLRKIVRVALMRRDLKLWTTFVVMILVLLVQCVSGTLLLLLKKNSYLLVPKFFSLTLPHLLMAYRAVTMMILKMIIICTLQRKEVSGPKINSLPFIHHILNQKYIC